MTSAVYYKVFTVPSTLNEYVEHFWALEAHNGRELQKEILVPNGRPSLIFSLGQSGTLIDPLTNQRRSNGNSYFSVTNRPFVIEQQGHAKYIGAQLKPYGLAAFSAEAHPANSFAPISKLFGKQAVNELLTIIKTASFPGEANRHIEFFLLKHCTPIVPHNYARIKMLTAKVEECSGDIKAAQLASYSHMSHSTMQRLFRRYIGLSAEQYIGVIRFASFVRTLTQNHTESTRLLAALHGYYDEPHAAREFKKYTGVSKSAFAASYDGIARLMYHE